MKKIKKKKTQDRGKKSFKGTQPISARYLIRGEECTVGGKNEKGGRKNQEPKRGNRSKRKKFKENTIKGSP